ncbi:MAG: Uma2 family endonuclease [Acidobacteriaceae bacterium]|nr:Uma2 family endonuclease [Acidobacteriaceae bacterium]
MGAGPQLLTLEEFRLRYVNEKPYFEYWFGEAVQKVAATTAHGVLQAMLCKFLDRAGYRTAPEVELRIDPNWQPVPDVLASLLRLESPYPTKLVEVVMEVLSPTDAMSLVHEKCQNYERIGFKQIFVLDPESRKGWEWSRATQNLERIDALRLTNGKYIVLADVWQELDKELQ